VLVLSFSRRHSSGTSSVVRELLSSCTCFICRRRWWWYSVNILSIIQLYISFFSCRPWTTLCHRESPWPRHRRAFVLSVCPPLLICLQTFLTFFTFKRFSSSSVICSHIRNTAVQTGTVTAGHTGLIALIAALRKLTDTHTANTVTGYTTATVWKNCMKTERINRLRHYNCTQAIQKHVR